MSGGSIVPTRLGAALALLTIGGLLAIVQIIVSAGSTARTRPGPAHERHLGLDAAVRRNSPPLAQAPASFVSGEQQLAQELPLTPLLPPDIPPPTSPVPPLDVPASKPPVSDASPGSSHTQTTAPPTGVALKKPLPVGADARDTPGAGKVQQGTLATSGPQPPARVVSLTADVTDSAAAGTAVLYTRLFARSFPQQDSGIGCLDLQPGGMPRACGEACSAEVSSDDLLPLCQSTNTEQFDLCSPMSATPPGVLVDPLLQPSSRYGFLPLMRGCNFERRRHVAFSLLETLGDAASRPTTTLLHHCGNKYKETFVRERNRRCPHFVDTDLPPAITRLPTWWDTYCGWLTPMSSVTYAGGRQMN